MRERSPRVVPRVPDRGSSALADRVVADVSSESDNTDAALAALTELVGHRRSARDDLHRELLADYDRRRSTRWGRFLLWLLRNTT